VILDDLMVMVSEDSKIIGSDDKKYCDFFRMDAQNGVFARIDCDAHTWL
jgi:hypothetical protein